MSDLEREVPPAGEELHLPGPSLHPVLLTVGITFTLVGVTISIVLVVLGGLLTLFTLAAWIRGARREYEELPLEHH
jgi:hypothetical protein